MKHWFICYTQKHKMLERFFARFGWYRAMVIRGAIAILNKGLYENLRDEVSE